MMQARHSKLLFFLALLGGLLLILGSAFLSGRLSVLTGFLSHRSLPAAHSPVILYLSPTRGTSAIWYVTPGSDQPARLLTHGNGSIIDFVPSPHGDWVAFSAGNNQGGSDLWLVDRGGGRQRVLVRCGVQRCEAPAWSTDGKAILFGRLPGDADSSEPFQPWLVDPTNGNALRFDNDPLVGYLSGVYSPDGKHLAFYDPNAKGIRVRELFSGQEAVLQSNARSPGSWSPDSQKLVFNTEESSEGFTYMKVYVMDFASGKPTLLLGREASDASDYGVPQWSPDGQWLVYNQRALSGNPSKQLRLVHPDGSGAKALTEDLMYSSAGYRWSPDSRSLVFQRFAFGSSENVPEVVWLTLADGKQTVLAHDAAAPQWLP